MPGLISIPGTSAQHHTAPRNPTVLTVMFSIDHYCYFPPSESISISWQSGRHIPLVEWTSKLPPTPLSGSASCNIGCFFGWTLDSVGGSRPFSSHPAVDLGNSDVDANERMLLLGSSHGLGHVPRNDWMLGGLLLRVGLLRNSTPNDDHHRRRRRAAHLIHG